MKYTEQYELPNNFLKFVEICEKDKHEIIVLKQTYENVWFTIDGYKLPYYKRMTCSNEEFYRQVVNILNKYKILKEAGLLD